MMFNATYAVLPVGYTAIAWLATVLAAFIITRDSKGQHGKVLAGTGVAMAVAAFTLFANLMVVWPSCSDVPWWWFACVDWNF